jgi:diguanylate cyclase
MSDADHSHHAAPSANDPTQQQSRASMLERQLADVRQQLDETRKKLDEMRKHALIDSLTNVGNRRSLNEELGRRIAEFERYGKIFSIIAIDLDALKSINDHFGHPAGDALLKGIASELVRSLRNCDQVFRYGGDEFVALLPETNLDQAHCTASRLCDSVARLEIELEQNLISSSISAGVAQVRSGEDAAQLMARADRQMYAAKSAGGNRADADTAKQQPS